MMPDENANALTPAEHSELEGYQADMKDTRSWFSPANQAKRDRSVALYGKQIDGTPAAPLPSGTAARKAELHNLMRDTHSEYYKNPTLQAEYRALLHIEEAGGERSVMPDESVDAWAKSLGVEVAEAQAMQTRLTAMAAEIGDTREAETVFGGWSDSLQSAFLRITARPQDRIRIIDSLDDAAFAELEHAIESAPQHEFKAVCKAWGLAA